MCRRWNALCGEKSLWHPLAKRVYPSAFQRAPPTLHAAHAWFAARCVASRRWHRAAPANVLTLTAHVGTVFGVTNHPLVPEQCLSAGEDGILRTWDCRTGSLLSVALPAGLGGMFNVHAWCDEASSLAYAAATGFSGDVCLLPYDQAGTLEPGRSVTLAGHGAPVVSARTRGDVLASCSFDGSIRVWSVSAALAFAAARREGGTSAAGRGAQPAVLFSTHAALLNDVPAQAGPLGPHEYSVAAVCLPPGDPNRLARGGNDGQVKVWDLSRGVVTAAFAQPSGWIWCLEHAGDAGGHVLVSGATDASVRVWDIRTPGGGAVSACTLRDAGPIAGLAVRSAEHRFVTGSFDGSVRLFDLRLLRGDAKGWLPRAVPVEVVPCLGAQLGAPLRAHGDRVTRVAATDAYAVSASFDGTLRVWRFDDL